MSELDFNSPEVGKIFFDKIFDERIRLAMKDMKYDQTQSATVVSVGTGVASLKMQGASNITPNVKNKCGEVLNIGDEVYVELINGSKNNIVIKYKK